MFRLKYEMFFSRNVAIFVAVTVPQWHYGEALRDEGRDDANIIMENLI